MKTQSKRKKFLIITVALALIAFIGIGYAYLAKTLNITGTANINSDFNVEFVTASIVETEDLGNVTGEVNLGTTTVDGDTVTIAVTLTEPGQSYSVVIPVKNTGEITALYAGITSGEDNPVEDDIDPNVNITFAPASGITQNVTQLEVDGIHNFNFNFAWNNSANQQNALTGVTYTFTYTIVYKQA